MALGDYKNIAQVQKEFGVKYEETNFIPAAEMEPSPIFQSEFAFTLENFDVYTSEAARTEAIIFPILRELYKSYYDHLSLWIQAPLAYNDKLKGTPDYLLATKSPLGKTVLETPLVAIVEAKKNDFEQGWGQCLAELVAAQKLNQDETAVVYGIVTDGKLWEVGKLAQTTFIKNGESFTVDHLARLFGVLNFIFQAAATNHQA